MARVVQKRTYFAITQRRIVAVVQLCYFKGALLLLEVFEAVRRICDGL